MPHGQRSPWSRFGRIEGELTTVLVEQVGAADLERLADLAGHLTRGEQWGIDDALVTVLGLR